MISYRIDVGGAHAHLFHVTLTIARPAAEQYLSLPVWIPGSYLVREFARHLSGLQARQGRRELPLQQIDKATWLVRCTGRAVLKLSYQVYAFDTSVRAAYLDARRGFFNGTSLCLRVHGREREPHHLTLGKLPSGWDIATALPAAPGRRRFKAADYDELVDCPFELGRFWRGSFRAAGVPHEFAVTGALPSFDGKRLITDARRICEAHIAFWHGRDASAKSLPFGHYLFMLNAVEEGYGGLEHRNSTALITARRNLPRTGVSEQSDARVTLLGLISHEYFHAWNVKRLRPAEFSNVDYTRENYTELLWFFEGFTSYYDDLLLLRAGLIDEARYLTLLAKTLSAVLALPGRKTQSLAQASFDAWVKYYRSDENTPNSTVSYYAKGSLVALALDLSLRVGSHGKASLDQVMRGLWAASGGGPIAEADIMTALRDVAGRTLGERLAKALRSWVHGTDDPPLQALLQAVGVSWQTQPPTLAQRWGLRVSESALTGVKVTSVLRGGAAERAGLAAGDELLAIDGWRWRKLEDASAHLRATAAAQVLVSRDQRVLSLDLLPTAPQAQGSVQLKAAGNKPSAAALALRKAWAGG
ncbi:MAG: PDZ domain-containing protein [Burkholderiaceae bacterium]|nr:PDZ domain-containing protein [Burkholderiaceae bacterium]